jgi:hypothetical protein
MSGLLLTPEPILCKPDGDCPFCKERGNTNKKFVWEIAFIKKAENDPIGDMYVEEIGYFCSIGHFWAKEQSKSNSRIKIVSPPVVPDFDSTIREDNYVDLEEAKEVSRDGDLIGEGDISEMRS